MKTRTLVSILIVLFAFLIIAECYAVDNKNEVVLSTDDFLIIEIKEEDAQNYGIEVDYDNFDNTRFHLRKLNSIFLRKFRSIAKYLILDFWFSDHGFLVIDNEFISELRKTKNVTLCAYGVSKGQAELSLAKFRNAVGEVFHSQHHLHETDGVSVPSSIRIGIKVEELTVIFEIRHVALLVLNKLKIPYDVDEYIYISSDDIYRFKRISFTEAIANPSVGKDKIVILIRQFKGQEDIHLIQNYGEITGPELICNFIMYIANSYSIQKIS
jgi:hypothetical protein